MIKPLNLTVPFAKIIVAIFLLFFFPDFMKTSDEEPGIVESGHNRQNKCTDINEFCHARYCWSTHLKLDTKSFFLSLQSKKQLYTVMLADCKNRKLLLYWQWQQRMFAACLHSWEKGWNPHSKCFVDFCDSLPQIHSWHSCRVRVSFFFVVLQGPVWKTCISN